MDLYIPLKRLVYHRKTRDKEGVGTGGNCSARVETRCVESRRRPHTDRHAARLITHLHTFRCTNPHSENIQIPPASLIPASLYLQPALANRFSIIITSLISSNLYTQPEPRSVRLHELSCDPSCWCIRFFLATSPHPYRSPCCVSTVRNLSGAFPTTHLINRNDQDFSISQLASL